jgi:hypothetical protein
MLHGVALVKTDAKALRSSETSVLTRATRRNNPEGAILYVHSVTVDAKQGRDNYILREFLIGYVRAWKQTHF